MIPDGMAFDAGVADWTFMLGQINAKAAAILRELRAIRCTVIRPAAESVAELTGVEVGFAQQELEADGGEPKAQIGEFDAQYYEVWRAELGHGALAGRGSQTD